MLPNSYPSLQEFAAHVAAVVGKIEIIRQPLYDRVVYPTAGALNFAFFQNPIGGGATSESGVAAGSGKVLADTNMTQNGLLPAPQAFWAESIEVYCDPGSSNVANTFTTQPPVGAAAAAAAAVQAGSHDVNIILNAGTLELTIGTKRYFVNGPLYKFPPARQKRLDVGLGIHTTAGIQEVTKDMLWVQGEPCRLDPGIGIPTSMNFAVNVAFGAVQATPSGFNARLGVELGGWLFRAAQ